MMSNSGAYSSDERYDGNDALSPRSRLPARTNFEVRAATDGVLFPFSRYPKHLPGGSATHMMLVDASILLRSEFSLYYAGTTPTQFGQRFATVFHSQVVVVKRGTPGEEFAQRELKPIDKIENRILAFSTGDQTASIPTQIAIDGHTFPHGVFVSFFGGLDVPADTHFESKPGTKYAFSSMKVPCPASGCSISCASLAELKMHFGRKHTDEDTWRFACSACDKMFASKAALSAHERNHRNLYKCAKCSEAFGQKTTLIRHLFTQHRQNEDAQAESSEKYCSWNDTRALNL